MHTPLNRRTVLKGAAGATALTITATRVGRAQEASPSAAEASPAANGDSRVISAANGEIEIAGTPQRVIGLEYELVENLVILGVEPVGVSEPESINGWVPLETPLADSIVDVGTRDELNMETIIALEPDLILAASPRQDEVLANLESIAPTVQLQTYSPFFTPAEEMTPIEHFQLILTQVAQATNTVPNAEAAITEFDALLAAGAEAIAQTEFAGRPFVYAGISEFTSLNLFNEHSRIAYTMAQLGFVNQAGENTETPGLHYEVRALEDLGSLPEDTLFFVAISPQIAEEANELFTGELWQGMPWIDGFTNLGSPNIWTAGSAITLSNLIERVVTAVGGTIEA